VAVLTPCAEYLGHPSSYQGKALATGALRWAVHAFPVMATAEIALLAMLAVRRMREGNGRV
jgi:hypothetical protein